MFPSGQTVLVGDDEEVQLRVAEIILRRAGYSPITAGGPLVALKKSRDFTGEIHLLLTDVRMPEMDGITLAQQILIERPQIRVLLFSAHPTAVSRLPLLRKPFRPDQLLKEVAETINSPLPLLSDVFGDQEAMKSRSKPEMKELNHSG